MKKNYIHFQFLFVKLRLVAFHDLPYQLVTIILHKISICKKLRCYNGKLLTDTFTAMVWSFMLIDFVCMFCAKIEGQMRIGCELRMWILFMFASLPHDLNFFSKTSNEYSIVVFFPYAGVIYGCPTHFVSVCRCTVAVSETLANRCIWTRLADQMNITEYRATL